MFDCLPRVLMLGDDKLRASEPWVQASEPCEPWVQAMRAIKNWKKM